MVKIICDHCKEPTEDYRYLLAGLERWHLCKDCFFKLKEWCIGESK